MALALYDRVRETSTIVGTGTATLLGAVPGYQSFSVVGNANTTYYCIFNTGTTEWEVGIGTYTSSGTTLSRTTILASSNSGSAVSFTAGTKDVFVTYPAGYTAFSTNNASQSSGQVLTSNGTGVGPTWQAAPAAAAGTLTGSTLASGVTASSLTSVGTLATLTVTAAISGSVTGSAATFTSTSQNSQFNSIGVGTAGSTTAGEIRATNNVTAYYSSDERLKDNVKIIPDALAKVLQIRGVEFDWNNLKDPEDGYFVRKHDVGVIAQEIEKVLPEVVAVREDGIKAVKYDRIIPLLIEAIKELEAKVSQLEAK